MRCCIGQTHGVIVRLKLSSYTTGLSGLRVVPSEVRGKETPSPSEVAIFDCRGGQVWSCVLMQ